MRPVSPTQIQALTNALDGPYTPCAPKTKRRLVPVRVGYCVPRICFGPSAVSVPRDWETCEPQKLVVEAGPCVLPPKTDRTDVQTIAEGVAQGLRSAPSIVARAAPWNEPDYRGVRYPQTATTILSTFAATTGQYLAVEDAIAGPWSVTIGSAIATAGSPVSVLAFQATDSYRGDELVVSSQDQQVLSLFQWTVTVNGNVVAGPFGLIGGRAPLALNARKGETISVNAIVPTGGVVCTPVLVLVNGWQYPALTQVDGTYTKSLRSSPSWPGSRRDQ